MSACSSAELEPGPVDLLDENAAVIEPSPPVFAPLAKEFSDALPSFYATFDDSIARLTAESTIDVASGIVDALGAVPTHLESGVNQEALANLQVAEDGFRVARDKTAALIGNLPPDVQQPTGFALLTFRVHDAGGAPVAGALVQLDADFGTGTTRATDGAGVCSFGVGFDATVAYTVTAAGFVTASGVATRAEMFVTIPVTLQAG